MFAQPDDPVTLAIQRAKAFELTDVPGGIVFLSNIGRIDYDTVPLSDFDCTSRVKSIVDEVRKYQPPVAIPGRESYLCRAIWTGQCLRVLHLTDICDDNCLLSGLAVPCRHIIQIIYQIGRFGSALPTYYSNKWHVCLGSYN